MSLQPFRTVDRRSSWRARITLWDRDSFQPIQIGRVGAAQNATVAFALFPEGQDCGWRDHWRDYGWCRPWRRDPVLSISTYDGTGFLSLEAAPSDTPDAPASAVILNLPPYQVAAIPRGQYRTSLVAAYADGAVLDLGSEQVTFRGEPLRTSFALAMMAGGLQPVLPDGSTSGLIVGPLPPILPAPYAPYA